MAAPTFGEEDLQAALPVNLFALVILVEVVEHASSASKNIRWSFAIMLLRLALPQISDARGFGISLVGQDRLILTALAEKWWGYQSPARAFLLPCLMGVSSCVRVWYGI